MSAVAEARGVLLDITRRIKEGSALVADNVWPASLKKLSTPLLQAMDEAEFRELCSRVRQRAVVAGHSRRHADRLVRKLQLRRSPHDGVQIPKRLLVRKMKPSPILSELYPARDKRWLSPLDRRETPTIELKDFSFLDDPRKTLQFLEDLARAEASALEASVDFDDNEVLDIGPYLVLGLMRQDMVPFMRGGKITPQTRSVIEAVDLRHSLNMKKFREDHLAQAVYPFRLKRRRGVTARHDIALQVSTKEKVADELVTTVNYWMSKMAEPRELTIDGVRYLQSVLTELLDNAERHSNLEGDRDGDWAVAGFMVRRNLDVGNGKKAWVAVCHLAIVSVGSSIAESIATADQETLEYMEGYCRRHRSKDLDDEALATVYAMQDGVSRVSQVDGASKGGTGMMDMAEFVTKLTTEAQAPLAPQIAVISGHTCVTFKQPYEAGTAGGDDRLRRLQWFNSSNSIDSSPDMTHVFMLRQRFPGTIISLRFALPAAPAGEVRRDDD